MQENVASPGRPCGRQFVAWRPIFRRFSLDFFLFFNILIWFYFCQVEFSLYFWFLFLTFLFLVIYFWSSFPFLFYGLSTYGLICLSSFTLVCFSPSFLLFIIFLFFPYSSSYFLLPSLSIPFSFHSASSHSSPRLDCAAVQVREALRCYINKHGRPLDSSKSYV